MKASIAAVYACLILPAAAAITDKDWHPITPRIVFMNKLTGWTNALLADTDSTLYAGGTFGVLRWNGGFWHYVGGGGEGEVHALALDAKGSLYAGGKMPALKNIARWDGKIWSSLGTGTDKTVLALAVTGSGELYAGGLFDSIGGVKSKYVAKWDGRQWVALGAGIVTDDIIPDADGGGVYTLLPDPKGGVYAGGEFLFDETFSSVARWNGTTWSSLGDFYNHARGTTRGLAFDNLGNLYAGGTLLTSGSSNDGYHFLVWKGASWRGCDGGANITVTSLTSDAAGNVHLGGEFYAVGANDLKAYGVAKYHPTAGWKGLDTSASKRDKIRTVAVNKSGKLFSGGEWRTIPERGAYVAALREETLQWTDVEAERTAAVPLKVNVVIADERNHVYAGGSFTTLGNIVTSNIAEWDGRQWKRLGQGIEGEVKALAADGKGNVYAAGRFVRAGGIDAIQIAKWNGTTWSPLGKGISGPAIHALALDGKGNLYVGGDLIAAGGITLRNLAKWDGVAWSAVGGAPSGPVRALAFRRQDGNIYAGGDFTHIGDKLVTNIARWDGNAWFALGGGLYDSFADSVDAITVDSAGLVYAGGSFTLSGGTNLAVWNGTVWKGVGGNITGGQAKGSVNSLAVRSGKEIYAGGVFTEAGGARVKFVAKWDGAQWDPLGSGVDGFVHSVALCDSFLYVGGSFDTAGGQAAPALAKVNTKGSTPVVSQGSVADFWLRAAYRFEGSRLLLSSFQPEDRVWIYALDGRPLARLAATHVVDLQRFSQQPIAFRVLRAGRTVASGRRMLR